MWSSSYPVAGIDGGRVVDGAEPEVALEYLGRTDVPTDPVAGTIDDVVETIEEHGHPADPAFGHGHLEVGMTHGVPRPEPFRARRQGHLAEHGGAQLQHGTVGGHVGHARGADVQADDGIGLGAGFDDGIPVAAEDGGEAKPMRSLGKAHRAKTPFGVAPDLGRTQDRIGQEGDAQRDDPIGVGRVPLLVEPVVPGSGHGQPELGLAWPGSTPVRRIR